MTTGQTRARPTAVADDRERWAELADLALVIAREIQFRGYIDERAERLTPSEGMVMRFLHQQPDAAPSTVAAATGLRRPNLSAVLRGLENKGLIERRPHGEDRRGVVIHLTERGRTNYATVRAEWADEVSTAAGHDASHLDAALALLTVVRDGLVAGRPEGASS